jgi:hypothetical protein
MPARDPGGQARSLPVSVMVASMHGPTLYVTAHCTGKGPGMKDMETSQRSSF